MKTVLIIDDEAEFRTRLAEILSSRGWQVLQAEDGTSGLEMARLHQPPVILCDLLMPGGNGFQLCRLIRETPNLRETRILVVSGRQFESDRRDAMEAGANDYLAKPFAMEDLVSRLEGMRGGAPEPGTRLSAASAGDQANPYRFWGVRGSVPTPGAGTIFYGGNTTCVEFRCGREIIILDAGTGLRLLGRELTREFGEKPLALTVLLTHTHWDHIQGLPFFQPVYRAHNRIRILGYEGAQHSLRNVLSSQMESPFFPIHLREVPANVQVEEQKQMSFEIGQVRVQAIFANHPGTCVGYRLQTPHGSLAFFPDNEPYTGAVRARVAAGEQPSEETIEFARKQEAKLIEFLRHTDVLIMDTQYDQDEYGEHIGWGHGCLDDVVALAHEAGVKKLYLFHHDPDHDDEKITAMVEHARKLVTDRGGALIVEAAREGVRHELGRSHA